MKKKFSHIDQSGNPKMVDVSAKAITIREARAQATVRLGSKIIQLMRGDDLVTPKGSVFQTAILAGVMGGKKTSELIPLCHPLALEDCQVEITVKKEKIIIEARARTSGKTGVEMEALTAATIAALTVYDMCKALSHGIIIEEICLLEKSGGKKNYKKK